MAKVSMIDVGGKRYEANDARLVEEFRCDGCGEFIAKGERLTLAGTITTPDGRVLDIDMDFHASHTSTIGTAIFKRITDTPPF